ncbi:hypothetical protein BDD12DRAFT_743934 [Trichophaea hybrida]|nr:hypothetical protein BDD12DRAFT_743934 [Trichophaea hybrida]
MFLIDDSDDIRDRWPAIKRSLIRFAELATRYDKDGIDLAFIHSDAEYKGITSDRLNEIMEDVEREVLQGVPGSSMAISLDQHLNEYTLKYEESRNHGPGHKCKYLNLIVLTSRDPGYMDGFDDTVLSYAQQLDDLHAPKFQLGIQFALIQSKPEDRVRFRRLDDQEGRDIVDATPYDPDTDEDNAEILVKVLCGAINPRIDNLELTPTPPRHKRARLVHLFLIHSRTSRPLLNRNTAS